MTSAITLRGIDQAVSHLKYNNENTLKYKFVRHIRKYYVDDNSVAKLKEIDHAALIKLLWDTDDDPEVIKNKRKNLNSLRSSVNADLKKLYEKGVNPEGIKIDPENIFVMSEDAKDNILNTYGYDLQPDGTLKLDQIMDILTLANESVSGSMSVEDTTRNENLRKRDQLKDLIKRLSEKLGLGAPEFQKPSAGLESQPLEFRFSPDDIEVVDEDEVLSEIEDIVEEEVLEEVADIKEDEILDEIEDDDVDVIMDDTDEDIMEDAEDVVINETEDSNPEMVTVEENIDEDLEDEADEEDTDLEYVDVVEDDRFGDSVAKEPGDESGTGIEDVSKDISLDRESGQGEDGNDLDETGSMIGDLKSGFEAEDKGYGEGIAEGKGDDNGSGLEEMDAVDEITELDDLDEIEAVDEDDILEDAEDIVINDTEDSDHETVTVEENIDEDLENEADEEDADLEYVDVVEDDRFGDSAAGGPGDESGTGENEKEKAMDQLGLPIDSLGQEFRSEKNTKLKKEKLLAEAFDGYLGSMDRYYNHFILIEGGEYSIGTRHPKKNEKPEQIVRMEPFYFARFPVTNGLFEIFVEKTGYQTTAEKVGYGTVYYGRFEKKTDDKTGLITSIWNSSLYYKVVKGACWYRPSGPESTFHNKRNHPVVQVSMEDAGAFAAWTGKRLPTENEWEAASRTANGWIFPWGHEWKNNACNVEESGTADTTPVDKYAEFENDFGIVDTLGNVLEWTSDGFQMTSQDNNETTYRIAKGGSWVSGNDIRLHSRFKVEPDSHSNIIGFRCVAY